MINDCKYKCSFYISIIIIINIDIHRNRHRRRKRPLQGGCPSLVIR